LLFNIPITKITIRFEIIKIQKLLLLKITREAVTAVSIFTSVFRINIKILELLLEIFLEHINEI